MRRVDDNGGTEHDTLCNGQFHSLPDEQIQQVEVFQAQLPKLSERTRVNNAFFRGHLKKVIHGHVVPRALDQIYIRQLENGFSDKYLNIRNGSMALRPLSRQ